MNAFLVPYQSNHNVSFNNYSEILILTLMKENVSNAVNAKNLFPIYEGYYRFFIRQRIEFKSDLRKKQCKKPKVFL